MGRLKSVVLVWEGAVAEGSIAELLASGHLDVISFREGAAALRFLSEGKIKTHALVLPDSIPLAQRIDFLHELAERAPAVFRDLPILMLERGRGVAGVKNLKRRGERRLGERSGASHISARAN